MQLTRDQINAKYRRDYDRLYVRSMQASSAEESAAIDERLTGLNHWRKVQLAFVGIQEAELGVAL